MDTPLVPTSMSGGQRRAVQAIMFLSLAFIVSTLVISLLRGVKHSEPGFIMVSVALVGFTLVSGIMLFHIRSGEAITEDKMKYVTVYQTLNVVFLCICLIVLLINYPTVHKPLLGSKCLKKGELGYPGTLPGIGGNCWNLPTCFGGNHSCLAWSGSDYVCATYNTTTFVCK